MNFMFKGGYRDTKVGNAEHTYVCIDVDDNPNNRYQFSCYGATTGTNNHFPVIKSLGDLNLAVAICCGDPTDKRKIYNKLSDRSGIIYGISGVCHQMANRILLAAKNNYIVLAPPSSTITFFIYGPYGYGWKEYLEQSIEITFKMTKNNSNLINKDRTAAVQKLLNNKLKILMDENNDKLLAKMLQLELDTRNTNSNLPIKRIKIFAEKNLDKNFDYKKIDSLDILFENFIYEKEKLDIKYLEDRINFIKYAKKINTRCNKMLKLFNKILTDKEYKKIFKLIPHKPFYLIDPKIAFNFHNLKF